MDSLLDDFFASAEKAEGEIAKKKKKPVTTTSAGGLKRYRPKVEVPQEFRTREPRPTKVVLFQQRIVCQCGEEHITPHPAKQGLFYYWPGKTRKGVVDIVPAFGDHIMADLPLHTETTDVHIPLCAQCVTLSRKQLTFLDEPNPFAKEAKTILIVDEAPTNPDKLFDSLELAQIQEELA